MLWILVTAGQTSDPAVTFVLIRCKTQMTFVIGDNLLFLMRKHAVISFS